MEPANEGGPARTQLGGNTKSPMLDTSYTGFHIDAPTIRMLTPPGIYLSRRRRGRARDHCAMCMMELPHTGVASPKKHDDVAAH